MAQQTYNCLMHPLPTQSRSNALHHMQSTEPGLTFSPLHTSSPPKVHATHMPAVRASAMCITEAPEGLGSEVRSTLLSALEAVHCPHSPS